jgi:hypothetical protein
MKNIFFVVASLCILPMLNAQVVRDHRSPAKTPAPKTFNNNASTVLLSAPREITLFESPGFTGQSKVYKEGDYPLSDFNDQASSIKVPPGMGVMIYENVNNAGGYGAYIDLLEDCADLSTYQFNDNVSFIRVFAADKPGYVYVRNKMVNNQFVPGHWERKRANGVMPDNSVPAIASSLPAQVLPTAPPKPDETIGVFRIELRIVTGKRENDDSDKEVFVKLNDNDADYFLDYGPDDFETGADRKYDIISNSIKTIADIKYILIGAKGDDVWGVQKVELYLNNSTIPVFSHTFPESSRINGAGNWSRAIQFGTDKLRTNPHWQTIATNEALKKPPVPVPYAMIRSMVESMIGNQMHHRSDNNLSWGNTSGANTVWGDHVEGNRVDGNTLHFDLDLEYEVTGVNPEIDVDFDLYFECTPGGAIRIKSQNIKVGCEILGVVSCQRLLHFINSIITMFAFDPIPIPELGRDNSFSAAFSFRPLGTKCKGVLVNPNGDVFMY